MHTTYCAQSITPAFIQKQCQIYGIAAITVKEKKSCKINSVGHPWWPPHSMILSYSEFTVTILSSANWKLHLILPVGENGPAVKKYDITAFPFQCSFFTEDSKLSI